MRLSADDYYKLYVNGHFVCQGPSEGYNDEYYYNEADITPFIVGGDNVIAAHVYYQGLINRVWNSGALLGSGGDFACAAVVRENDDHRFAAKADTVSVYSIKPTEIAELSPAERMFLIFMITSASGMPR